MHVVQIDFLRLFLFILDIMNKHYNMDVLWAGQDYMYSNFE